MTSEAVREQLTKIAQECGLNPLWCMDALEQVWQAALSTQPQWIPVEEKLPSDGEPVLFGWWNTPRGSVVSHYCAEIGMHRSEECYWESERTAPQDEPVRFPDESLQVTHWMSLPAPPAKP